MNIYRYVIDHNMILQGQYIATFVEERSNNGVWTIGYEMRGFRTKHELILEQSLFEDKKLWESLATK